MVRGVSSKKWGTGPCPATVGLGLPYRVHKSAWDVLVLEKPRHGDQAIISSTGSMSRILS